jgi:hypothetical protein
MIDGYPTIDRLQTVDKIGLVSCVLASGFSSIDSHPGVERRKLVSDYLRLGSPLITRAEPGGEFLTIVRFAPKAVCREYLS